MITRSAAILVLAFGASGVVACGGRALKAGAGTDSGISASAGGNGGETGGSGGSIASLPPCSGLDENSCQARRDCKVQTCVTCGVTSSSCFRVDETPAACPLHTCVRASCTGLNEANCNGTPTCTAVRCPDCLGGMTFAACADMGEQIGCGPCPPMDAGGAAESGGSGGRDECSADSDCAPPNLCALGADGAHRCVAREGRPGVDVCPTTEAGSTPCCSSDSECTSAPQGICVGWSRIWCGGPPPPPGNFCQYDECEGDADCSAHPNGFCTAGYRRLCVYGPCRTSADCTKGPGGLCVMDQIGAFCAGPMVFCRYANDPCRGNGDCPSSLGSACVPSPDLQGTMCTIRPPPA
jgi:hypothetical protein